MENKYYFWDKVVKELLLINAEDEEEAWWNLCKRHCDMGKGCIIIENAKKRYELRQIKEK